MFVTQEMPRTRMPRYAAAMTSGTVDMPDQVHADGGAHAYLGRRLIGGPGKAAYTPSFSGVGETAWAKARSAGS